MRPMLDRPRLSQYLGNAAAIRARRIHIDGAILRAISGETTPSTIAAETGIEIHAVRNALARMKQEGRVVQVLASTRGRTGRVAHYTKTQGETT